MSPPSERKDVPLQCNLVKHEHGIEKRAPIHVSVWIKSGRQGWILIKQTPRLDLLVLGVLVRFFVRAISLTLSGSWPLPLLPTVTMPSHMNRTKGGLSLFTSNIVHVLGSDLTP